jgi:hypothetical protein
MNFADKFPICVSFPYIDASPVIATLHTSRTCTNTRRLQLHLTSAIDGDVSYALQAGRSGNRIPEGAKFSYSFHPGPGAHPASCTVCTEPAPPGVNRQGCGVNYPPSPIAEIKEKIELHP